MPPEPSPPQSGTPVVSRIDSGGGPVVVINDDNDGKIYMGPVYQNVAPPDRSRARMLARVREHWVERPLQQLLRGAPLIDVTAQLCSDALAAASVPAAPRHRPAGRLGVLLEQSARPDPASHTLPPGTKLWQVLDEHDGELLVLGEPGSGKTTLLLDLARTLIGRAEQDDAAPIPVIFQLASWGVRRRALDEWLIDELAQPGGYDVNLHIARRWVEEERILPLLDGLDEVEYERRSACVEAINAFRESRRSVTDLVVTCRVADYEMLRPVRLDLRGAVLLRALDAGQIDTYLAQGGARLSPLRRAVAEDPAIRDMASSPLLLSIMAPVYAMYDGAPGVPGAPTTPPAPPPTPPSGTESHDRLFAAYVDGMFARQGSSPHYSRAQTLRWLAWLSASLTHRAESVLYLERLQPDWLPNGLARGWYAVLDRAAVGILVALALGVPLGLLGALFGGPEPAALGGLGFGLIGALVGALLGGQGDAASALNRSLWRGIRAAVLAGLAIGIVSGLVGGVAGALRSGASDGAALALIAALAGGLVGGVAGGLAGPPGLRPRRIAVVETVRWSATAAARSALGGLALGAAVGAGAGVIGSAIGVFGAASRLLAVGLTAVLFGLIFALGLGLVGGLIPGEVGPKEWVVPNQGIRRSARRALLVGTGVGVLGTLAFGLLFFGLHGAWWFGAQAGLLVGAILGPLAALAFGGYACLSHAALRVALWRAGALPLAAVGFLDYAVQCNFLYRVGGGYRFVHALWQQYFAARSER
ncbi:MAG TPA: NACHT domain-containing protein [Chloroflexota bacterium]|nr:NACHT domain-containing protein [Chloroflexota bacterium]